MVNAAGVELPDVPELLRELRGLERRRGPSGRDRIDHRSGSHDDRANAAAGVAALLRPSVAAASGWADPPEGMLKADYGGPARNVSHGRREGFGFFGRSRLG
jgi:hypothetical protein